MSQTDDELAVQANVRLAPYTTLGLGGPARYFVVCSSAEQVRAALAHGAQQGQPVFVLGGGSNIVFPDAGYPGLVLRVAINHIELRDGTTEITAGAGADWDALVRTAVAHGWTGVECLSGIPGTVGGTPIQNVGAYGQDVAETLRSVVCLDRTTLERRVFAGGECGFGYRTSRFKHEDRGRFVVLEVTFRLRAGAPPQLRYPELQQAVAAAGGLPTAPLDALRLVRNTVLALRRRKSMVLDPADPNTRSAGSFFLNPVLDPSAFADLKRRWAALGKSGEIPTYPAGGGVKVPAAWLVEQAGFSKGYRHGGVGISSRHALALVNHQGTSAELLALAKTIMDAVGDRFGVRLEPEPEIVA